MKSSQFILNILYCFTHTFYYNVFHIYNYSVCTVLCVPVVWECFLFLAFFDIYCTSIEVWLCICVVTYSFHAKLCWSVYIPPILYGMVCHTIFFRSYELHCKLTVRNLRIDFKGATSTTHLHTYVVLETNKWRDKCISATVWV